MSDCWTRHPATVFWTSAPAGVGCPMDCSGLDYRQFAVDISHDLLTIGRERLSRTGPARVVTGDAEALPFSSGAFDRVMCLNAIHHVPHIPTALGEVARVLNPEGLAVFSEPGVGHSEDAHARRAVQDFGVQEVDVDPTQFLDQCQRGRFRACRPGTVRAGRSRATA